jgi:hypothetical protein
MSLFTDAELVAFLDEALPAGRCAELEHELRSNGELRNRLLEVRGRESAGLHTIGAIWRRSRLSCPTRSELGRYVLGALPPDACDYVRFHADVIGCRYCQANLADLESASRPDTVPQQRRQRYFQTSAGYLAKRPNR